MINAAALRSLPEPLRLYFERHRFYLVAHASDPDALSATDPREHIHHFADVEAYDSYPFRTFHTEFVLRHSPASAGEKRNGDVMWQIERFDLRLAADFKAADWNDAGRDAVFCAHYAADLTQPLHTVLNFDGQRTAQNGIHKRFETDLVGFYADRWELHPAPAALIPNLRERIFAELLRSYGMSRGIFAADLKARARWSYSDPRFLSAFCSLAGAIAEAQIQDAAGFVGSLWYTAWARAGKPDLSGWTAQAARPVP
ncbi:MAG: hypothetical protein ACRD3D_05070 [Terriglobia bacterium]